jgi:hypothetical protein
MIAFDKFFMIKNYINLFVSAYIINLLNNIYVYYKKQKYYNFEKM